MEKLLQVTGLCKNFDGPHGESYSVLKDVSLSVGKGEVVCLMGVSGVGKSSLVSVITGSERADSGEIRSAVSIPGPLLGYLGQGERLLPWRSVLENVALARELLGATRKEAAEEAAQALARVGLSDFCAHLPGALSSGMIQRVMLARLFVLRPLLLILDEAFCHLDFAARAELGSLLREYVSAEGAGALVVTHSLDEAASLSDRVLVLGGSPARIQTEVSFTSEHGISGAHVRYEAVHSALQSGGICHV
jgi:NitT/TauT family transport system ATP-binding protein